MNLRWKQIDVNVDQMILQYEDAGEWKNVPMVGVVGQPLDQHPAEAKKKAKAHAKKLRDMVKRMKSAGEA